MKNFFQIIFFCFSITIFSQTSKPDKLKLISQGDTVIFSAATSGCFSAGTNIYKFAKLKNHDRNVIYKKANVWVTKKITLKNYDVFIYRFRSSEFKFKHADENGKVCTTVSKFEIGDQKESTSFTNNTCEAEFDPEHLLLELLK